ncbi:energy transducer TonB [Maricaulis sp. CAU 1757]
MSRYLFLSGLLAVLSACASPFGAEPRGAFIPTDSYPVPPNVERLIGPDDCQGATLSAIEAGVPDYPGRAWNRGRQGWAVVRFDVAADGAVGDARIARSMPSGAFDRAARRAVEGWRFEPLDGADRLANCVVMFEFRAGHVRIR